MFIPYNVRSNIILLIRTFYGMNIIMFKIWVYPFWLELVTFLTRTNLTKLFLEIWFATHNYFCVANQISRDLVLWNQFLSSLQSTNYSHLHSNVTFLTQMVEHSTMLNNARFEAYCLSASIQVQIFRLEKGEPANATFGKEVAQNDRSCQFGARKISF